jgi:hypothetical protein
MGIGTPIRPRRPEDWGFDRPDEYNQSNNPAKGTDNVPKRHPPIPAIAPRRKLTEDDN